MVMQLGGRGRQISYELEVSLVYIVSSRPTMATQLGLVFTKRKKIKV